MNKNKSIHILIFTFHNISTFQLSADYEICSQVAERPQNYLVPHPSDCTKFYSCQNLGWRGGWIAHLMDCPATTGFDTKLRICNYIKALPRCSKSKSARFYMKYFRVKNDVKFFLPFNDVFHNSNVFLHF